MAPILIILIVALIIGFLGILGGAFKSENQGLYSGGSKKGKFGVVGLVLALFGILGFSNYLQRVM
jgi:hypothetical protein